MLLSQLPRRWLIPRPLLWHLPPWQDAAGPPINARLIAGQLPDARVLYFDGWGHSLIVGEAGSRLANVTAQFLSGSEPEGAFAVPKAGAAGAVGAAPAPSPASGGSVEAPSLAVVVGALLALVALLA